MEIDNNRIRQLRTEIAHCTGRTDMPEDYQKHFAAHSPGSICLYCGDYASFTWGLAHGSGFCHKCGWPARLYHFVKDDANPGKDKRVVLLLQYHPNELILPGEPGAAAEEEE